MTVRTATATVCQGEWRISLDLQGAYLQVTALPNSWRFLRFNWGSSTWQFWVLRFGLPSVPQIPSCVLASCLLSPFGVLSIWMAWERSPLRLEQGKVFLGMRILSPPLKVFHDPGVVSGYLRSVSHLPRSSSPMVGLLSSLFLLRPGSQRRMLHHPVAPFWSHHWMSDSFLVSWDAAIQRDLA